jgi:small subunit ribosomal protein S2
VANIQMKELLEAGVHFGHQTRRWNPKMKPFIFGKRNGIHIVDLQKTLHHFEDAADFIRDLAANGRNVLFVGTKRQAQDAIREEAERCGMFFMNHRWLGGTMTNFRTIRKSIQRFKEIEEMLSNEESHLTKKERIRLERQRRKMDRAFGGIKDMEDLPDALFVVDTVHEHIAIKEANRLGIPVVAVRVADNILEGLNLADERFVGDEEEDVATAETPVEEEGGVAAEAPVVEEAEADNFADAEPAEDAAVEEPAEVVAEDAKEEAEAEESADAETSEEPISDADDAAADEVEAEQVAAEEVAPKK